MGLHSTTASMVKEALTEMIKVAKYTVDYRKDPTVWGSQGCYGYPSAVLLFSIADSIGSYVVGGNTRQHFDILNHPDYYNLSLDQNSIETIYKGYRCLLTHNSVMEPEAILDIGSDSSPVFEIVGQTPKVNLAPLLIVSKTVVEKFIANADSIVPNRV